VLSEEVEPHTERLRILGESKSDFDLNFEEFRGNYQLKQKMLIESSQTMQHRINSNEMRIKD